jgi:lipopolysaccharide export system permease protein
MIVFRSVLRELFTPFGSTCFVLTALLMMEKVYRLVSLVVGNRLRIEELGLMLVYLLPQILTITLPLAVVGAVFMTVIRHSLDSELICHRASGRSLWSYAGPYFVFGVVTATATAILTLWVQPISYAKYTDLQLDMVRYRAEEKIIPGEFNYDFGGKVIHVGARNPDKSLESVFIADKEYGTSSSVITAQHGRIDVDQITKKVVFKLQNGQIVYQDPDPTVFRTVDFATLNYVLDFQPGEEFEGNQLWSMPTEILAYQIQEGGSDDRRMSRLILEMYFRITTPMACFAFSIAALPLGIFNPRSGQTGSFVKAILLVVVYYVLWLGFKDLASNRVAPPHVLLLPPIFVTIYGLMRLWVTNNDADSAWQLLRKPRAQPT